MPEMQHKINSFNDFVDVTRELIARVMARKTGSTLPAAVQADC